MAEAFKCDLCGGYSDGEPEFGVQLYTVRDTVKLAKGVEMTNTAGGFRYHNICDGCRKAFEKARDDRMPLRRPMTYVAVCAGEERL